MALNDEKYYTKFGFGGLTPAGKLGFLVIGAIVGWLIWQGWVGPELAQLGQVGLTERLQAYGIGLAKVLGAAVAAGYAASLILPKQQFQRQEFFCNSCGASMGFVIGRCGQCGSNKYTTDPELADIRAKQKRQES